MDLFAAVNAMERAVEQGLPFALADGGELVASEAKQNHPYQNRTGKLESRTRLKSVRGSLRAGYTVEVVGDTKYGAFVEFGTSRSAAYPFLRPAWYRRQSEVARIVEDAMAFMANLA